MKFSFIFDQIYLVENQSFHEKLISFMFLESIYRFLKQVIEFL